MPADSQFCARSDCRFTRLPRLLWSIWSMGPLSPRLRAGACGAFIPYCLLGFLLFGGPQPLNASSTVPREYQIKAAFIFNFTKFVEWPSDHFESEDAPIVLGILGTNPFGDELANAVKGRQVAGRRFVVKEFAEIAAAHCAEMLFVPSGSEQLLEPEMLASLHRAGALTIGESAHFSQAGGMITFMTEGNRVRFIIDREAIGVSRLSFSAQLLNLAVATREHDE